MKYKLILTLFILLGVVCNGNEFNRLSDTFGSWQVRHVYDNETLQYRFSDAKTQLKISQSLSLPFQFNRSVKGEFSFLFKYARGRWEDINYFHGWITKTIIYVDGKRYAFESDGMPVHTFEGVVGKDFLSAVAQANTIKVELYVGDSLVAEGSIPTDGSYAALKWLRAI